MGKFLPILKPILDFLNTHVGQVLVKLLGADIPDAAGKAGDAIVGAMGDGTKAIEQAAKQAEASGKAFSSMLQPFFQQMEGNKWKDLFKSIPELGFEGKSVKKIKLGIDMEFGITDAVQKLQSALSFIHDFHIPAGDLRGFTNNWLKDLKGIIKEHPESRSFINPLIDIIKEHKNDPNSIPGSISYTLQNNPVLANGLKALGIDLNDHFKEIGTESGVSLMTALQQQLRDFKPDKGFMTALDLITGQVTQIERVKGKKFKPTKEMKLEAKGQKGRMGPEEAIDGAVDTISPQLDTATAKAVEPHRSRKLKRDR